jgi:putative ABC transport system permease protein
MKMAANIQEGIANLFSAKLRSFLALLGILVGTASVVAMVLGGQLATYETLKQFKSLGTDLFAISLSDADKHILAVAPYTQVYSPMQFEGHEVNGSVLGVTEEFGHISHIELQQGRFISDLDEYQFFCVIGHNVYDQIKSYSQKDPIGQQLQIGKAIFTIVGVAKPWPENNFVYASIDYSVLVPIKASTLLSKYSDINNILIRLSPNSDLDAAKNHIEH